MCDSDHSRGCKNKEVKKKCCFRGLFSSKGKAMSSRGPTDENSRMSSRQDYEMAQQMAQQRIAAMKQNENNCQQAESYTQSGNMSKPVAPMKINLSFNNQSQNNAPVMDSKHEIVDSSIGNVMCCSMNQTSCNGMCHCRGFMRRFACKHNLHKSGHCNRVCLNRNNCLPTTCNARSSGAICNRGFSSCNSSCYKKSVSLPVIPHENSCFSHCGYGNIRHESCCNNKPLALPPVENAGISYCSYEDSNNSCSAYENCNSSCSTNHRNVVTCKGNNYCRSSHCRKYSCGFNSSRCSSCKCCSPHVDNLTSYQQVGSPYSSPYANSYANSYANPYANPPIVTSPFESPRMTPSYIPVHANYPYGNSASYDGFTYVPILGPM